MRGKLYDTDLSEAQWAIVAPLLPPALCCTDPAGGTRNLIEVAGRPFV